MLIPNLLKCQFTATKPNTAWVTDITYIRSGKGGSFWPSWLAALDDFRNWLIREAA